MGELEGQVALVTGGASGLGKALVERFLQEGARIGIMDRARERIEALAKELGDRVSATIGDVTVLADNRRAVADTVNKFGRLDCFIGNAGVWDFNLSLAALPDDRIERAFDELFGINVKGCMLGAKAAMTELAQDQWQHHLYGLLRALSSLRRRSAVYVLQARDGRDDSGTCL
jgi:NAD(P)-dependent dehydrogenase (short-subunit alcohol dehydrogenase family)